jgi:hypothetical protein
MVSCLVAATLALGACGSSEEEDGTCGLTETELDEAVEGRLLRVNSYMDRFGSETGRAIEANRVPEPASNNAPCGSGSQEFAFDGNATDPGSGPYTNGVTMGDCGTTAAFVSGEVVFAGNKPANGSELGFTGAVTVTLRQASEGCFASYLEANWTDTPCSVSGFNDYDLGETTTELSCGDNGDWVLTN